MGGKTSTTSSGVTIPPEVLARYNSVNATAQDVAQTPFQQYSTNPNAFVAPLTPTQQAGIANTNAAVGMAQPYYNAATGFALAGSQPINAQPLNTSAYMNPYLQTVLGSTEANVNQQNQQAMSGQTGTAMQEGYFGGDRAGIAAAVLAGQQQLTGGQLYSGIASDAYNQAIAAAQQQQGVNLGAAQANRAATQQTGETLAGLGTTAQGTAMAGAQAQLGAGQVQQQTTQAGDTALYNQFLQQQSYPFQTAQFLANIAEGTGALSGNTTTTTQPGGLFSDERLKEGMEPIGKGFDGANIYRFRYKGDPTTRIGMSAQEVERRHPEAVGEHGGFKTLDYGAATDDAARRGGFELAANDNDGDERRARQAGGMSGWGMYPPGVNPMSIGELLQAQEQMYGPGFGGAGLYGGSSSGAPHGGSSYVPAPMQGQPMMIHGTPAPARAPTTASDALHTAAGLSGDVTGLEGDAKDASSAYNWLMSRLGPVNASGWGDIGSQATGATPGPNANGGFVRAARQDGGGFDPSDPQNDDPYGAKGPGLNIPTAPEQHQQLQGTKPPPGQQQSGVSQLLGAGADVASIAKAAPEIGAMASGIGSGLAGLGSSLASFLPFLALAGGGRVGRAEGGFSGADAIETALGGGQVEGADPVENLLLQRFAERQAHPPISVDAEAAPDGAPAGAPAGGGASAGFAGAKTPGAPVEAAGFAGAAPGGSPAGFAGTMKAEGTGLNAVSGAVGPGQFLKSTFRGEFKKMFPERAASMSDTEIDALHGTAEGNALQAQMIPHLRAENAATLQSHGLPVTPATEHVMWILGPNEGPKVLQADPSTPMESVVRPLAISENRRIMAGKTTGQFTDWADRSIRAHGGRAGFQDGGAPDDAANPTPDEIAAAEAKKAGFDPAVVDQAHANRAAAAAGQPSTPAAAAAVDAPAPVPAGAPVPAPPTDYGQAAASGFGRAAAAAPSLLPPAAAPGAGLQGADLTRGVGAPAAPAPTDVGPGGGSFLTNSQRSQQLATDDAQTLIRGQTQHPGGGLWNWATQPEHAIPMLTGLADMLSAPTKYPLVAITQGLKGGAQAYQAQRAYDAQTAMAEQERSQLGTGEATSAYQGATQRRQINAQIAGQMLQVFDGQYVRQDGMMSEDNSGPKWLGPQGYVTNAQHTALRNQIISGTYGGLAQAGEAAGPLSGMPLITAGAGGGSPVSGAASSASVPTIPNPGAVPVGGAAGHPGGGGPNPGAGPLAGGRTGGAGGPGGGAPGVGSIPAGGSAAVPPVAAPGAGHLQAGSGTAASGARGSASAAASSDPIDRRFRQGAYGNPVALPPQMTPDEAAKTLNPQFNPYVLQQAGQSEQAAAIFNGTSPAWNRDGTEYTGFRERSAAQGRYDQATKDAGAEWTRRQGLSRDFQQGAAMQQQYIDTLNRTYRDANFNVLSPEVASVIGSALSLPWVQQMVPGAAATWQGQANVAAKMTAAQQLLAAAASHGAPASTLSVAATALPGPDQPPDARYSILFQNQAQLAQQEAKQQAEAKYGGSVANWAQFDNDFRRAHPIEEFEDKVHMPFFAGQSMSSKVAHSYIPTKAEYAQLAKGDPFVKLVNGKRTIALAHMGGN